MCWSLCVCGWVAKEGIWDLISSIFEAVLESSEDLSLSILVQRPHKELGPRKPVRLEEKEKKENSEFKPVKLRLKIDLVS